MRPNPYHLFNKWIFPLESWGHFRGMYQSNKPTLHWVSTDLLWPKSRDSLSEFLLQIYSEWGREASNSSQHLIVLQQHLLVLGQHLIALWYNIGGLFWILIWHTWVQRLVLPFSSYLSLGKCKISELSFTFCEMRISNIYLSDWLWDLNEIIYLHPHSMCSINVSFHPFLSLFNVLLFWLFFFKSLLLGLVTHNYKNRISKISPYVLHESLNIKCLRLWLEWKF